MDLEKFKKESKVTYVHVKGKPTGVIVPRNKQDFSHDDFLYEGFIEVPFTYADYAGPFALDCPRAARWSAPTIGHRRLQAVSDIAPWNPFSTRFLGYAPARRCALLRKVPLYMQ